jgi:hypothetical protein
VRARLKNEERQEDVSKKFCIIDNKLDIIDNKYIRLIGDPCEYFELDEKFGSVYMGDDLVVLINIRR